MSSSLQQSLTQHFKVLNRDHPLYNTRQQALKDFEEQGLPTLKNEAYKYTPITSLLTAHFDLHRPIQTQPDEDAPICYHDMDAYHIVLLNGKVSSKHTQLEGHEPFMQVFTFQEAYQLQKSEFLEHFAQYAQSKQDAFTALNTALFEEGLFIRIHDHAIIDKPILLYHYTTTNKSQHATHPRLLVVAGKHSQASMITSWQTTGFTNAVAEVILQRSAQMNYYVLQTKMGHQHYQVNTTQCQQAQHSTLNTYTFTWSGALVRNNLSSTIDAPHSEANMYGLYYLRRQQHVDNCTTIDHRKPHTYSNELYKGIMMDKSTGIFNGRIYVRPEAQKTNALQTNNNLVLSNHATLHTKPQLEIWADDVKCSHGATTGRFDAEQLFYLRTRGLQENTAQRLLRQAFASEVIDKIPLATLREQLHSSWTAQEMLQ